MHRIQIKKSAIDNTKHVDYLLSIVGLVEEMFILTQGFFMEVSNFGNFVTSHLRKTNDDKQ